MRILLILFTVFSIFFSHASMLETTKIIGRKDVGEINYFQFGSVITVFLTQSINTPEAQGTEVVEEEPKKPKKVIKNLEYFLLAGFFILLIALYFFVRKKK